VVEAVTDNVGDLIDDVIDEAERTRGRIRRRRHSLNRRRHRGRGRRGDEAADLSPPAPPANRAEYPDVIGWQPLILNRPQSCVDCEEPIERGERGFVGMTAAGLSEIYLCSDCMDARH
jgi:hypothetical protein